MNSIENQSITDMTTTSFNFAGVLFNSVLILKMLTMGPVDVNSYPNYIYVYLLHLVSPLFFIFLVCVVYYGRNPSMTKTMTRETKLFVSSRC